MVNILECATSSVKQMTFLVFYADYLIILELSVG